MIKSLYKSILILPLLFILCISNAAGQDTPEWHEFEEALALADRTNKPIIVDVGAPWCGWCHKMKQEVYPNLDKQVNHKFIFTRLNRDDNNSKITYGGRSLTPLKISQELGVQQVPSIVILNEKGEYLMHKSGFTKSEELKSLLKIIASAS